MSWPVSFPEPTREGLVLVPSPEAMMQDLGPFRSGRDLETDLLPRSALICAADGDSPLVDEEGYVRFAFEGNAVGAANMELFHERCLVAAGRLATRAPSVAYGRARPNEVHAVAGYDLLAYEFVEVLDQAALEAWSGEEVESYLPPASLQTPCCESSVIAGLCTLPMTVVSHGTNGIYLWKFADGTILSREASGSMTAWRRGDEGLEALLSRAGVSPARKILMSALRG